MNGDEERLNTVTLNLEVPILQMTVWSHVGYVTDLDVGLKSKLLELIPELTLSAFVWYIK